MYKRQAYARKKEVGINPAIARSLRLKLWIMSGMSGPRILVINEMVNQNAIILSLIHIWAMTYC